MRKHSFQNGIVNPQTTNVPARVLNSRSKKRLDQPSINLETLLSADTPQICVQRRLGGIGDVIMTTPLLKAIKTLIPHCHLVYATDMKYANGALADVINHNPYVDELIPFDQSLSKKWDYCVDVTSTGLNREKSGSIPPNRIDMFASAAGVDVSADPVPIYEVTYQERDAAIEYIKKNFLEGADRKDVEIIAIQARSNDDRRTWPLEHVNALADLLAKDKNKRVLIFDWGAKAEHWESRERVYTVKDMPLTETAAIVENADCIVCPDSSMLHLAGAIGKKIVTIFGPIPPESRINYYANTTAVTYKMSCQYCWYSPSCRREKSGIEKYACLTKVTPEMVSDAVNKKLKEPMNMEQFVVYGANLTDKGQDKVILVRRTSPGIGDLLMATTGIELLKKEHPDKEIHVAVQDNLMPLLESSPFIDKVISCKDSINYKRYYMTIDISSPCARYEYSRLRSGRSVEKSRVELFAEALGVKKHLSKLTPSYYVSKEEDLWVEEWLNKNPDVDFKKPFVAFTMKSAEKYRDWPISNFRELFKELKSEVNIVILDSSREYFYDGTVDACGFPIRHAAAILKICDLLVTVDTGLLHLAAALDIPTIAMFGPIDYKARCKGYKNVTVVKSECPHMPCWRNKTIPCKVTGEVSGYSKCMGDIKPKLIADTILEKVRRQ